MTYDAWSGGIDAQSGCRLPLPHRANLDARGQAAMDRQMDPARGSLVGLRGPTGIRLHSPFVAEHAQALVDYFRRDSTLDPRTQVGGNSDVQGGSGMVTHDVNPGHCPSIHMC